MKLSRTSLLSLSLPLVFTALLCSCSRERFLPRGEGKWNIDRIYKDTCRAATIFGAPGCAVTWYEVTENAGTITFEKKGGMTLVDSTGTISGTWEAQNDSLEICLSGSCQEFRMMSSTDETQELTITEDLGNGDAYEVSWSLTRIE